MARALRATVLLGAALIHLAWGCSSDLECSLNGVCMSGSCICDAAWTGSDCGLLDLLPAANHVSFHGLSPNTTSWGGSILPVTSSAAPTSYVMYAAEMTNGCDLGSWTTNSEVVVATAASPEGPYTEHSQAIAPWAHNPEAIYVPARASEGAVWCIFSLGDGVPIHGQPKNCGTPGSPETAPRERVLTAPQTNEDPVTNRTVSFVIHFSNSSHLGPWAAHTATVLDFPSNYDFPGNWNPAPVLLPDGRVRVMCHTDTSPWGGEVILEASSWRGPYKPITTDITTCSKCEEDPFMWFDKRGNWHVLYHKMFDDGGEQPSSSPIPSPGWAGGHSYSRDGLSWSPIGRAFNTSVAFRDGTVTEMQRRERPKLIFASDGVTPTHMSNGVVGPLGTYTIVVPLRTDA